MPCNEWISESVEGKTFADVGGLWGTVNEKVTVAARGKAKETTMIDIQTMHTDPWKQFFDRCAAEGVRCDRSIEANINDPDFPKKVGNYDIVHCSGVIYHCPNPVYTVSQLAKITNNILILGSTIIPPIIKNANGEIIIETGGGIFVPALNDSQREVIAKYFKEVGTSTIVGIDHPLQNGWSLEDYSAWWWLFTLDFVGGLLKACGFKVKYTYTEWEGRVAYFLAIKE